MAACSWNEESFGDDAQLTSVQFLDESTAFITGEFGMVLKTSDGGASWERIADIPGEFYPQAAHFVDAERGWAVGLNGAILHTSDGGESWQSQDSGVNIPLYGITGAGETLYAVGENGFVLRYAAGSWQACRTKTTYCPICAQPAPAMTVCWWPVATVCSSHWQPADRGAA